MNDVVFWLWFIQIFGFSNNKNNKFLAKLGSPQKLIISPQEVISQFPSLTDKQKDAILQKNFRNAERIIEICNKLNIKIITIQNNLYSKNLRNISCPPFLLFCKGDLSLLNHNYPISMVGTRKPDNYGIGTAKTISSQLTSLGALVISGLAHGCDSICHLGALDSNGKTLGVAVCGLDIDYPSESCEMRNRIIENGLIISEYPPGFHVDKRNFHMRNRIISGLSLATIIVECTERSGTMLTAAHALSQNRDIYAVTGDVFSKNSRGPLSLLKDGAMPFTSSIEIMEHYIKIYNLPAIIPNPDNIILKSENNIFKPDFESKFEKEKQKTKIPDFLTDEQKKILKLLSKKSLHIDTISQVLQIPSYKLLGILTELEILSLAEALPGGTYKSNII